MDLEQKSIFPISWHMVKWIIVSRWMEMSKIQTSFKSMELCELIVKLYLTYNSEAQQRSAYSWKIQSNKQDKLKKITTSTSLFLYWPMEKFMTKNKLLIKLFNAAAYQSVWSLLVLEMATLGSCINWMMMIANWPIQGVEKRRGIWYNLLSSRISRTIQLSWQGKFWKNFHAKLKSTTKWWNWLLSAYQTVRAIPT